MTICLYIKTIYGQYSEVLKYYNFTFLGTIIEIGSQTLRVVCNL